MFFLYTLTHRVPPSLPTRRSSDLTICRKRRRSAVPRPCIPNTGIGSKLCPRPCTPRPERRPRRRLLQRPPRSEEHTSELQSPDHLVCRLLLEKKKNI